MISETQISWSAPSSVVILRLILVPQCHPAARCKQEKSVSWHMMWCTVHAPCNDCQTFSLYFFSTERRLQDFFRTQCAWLNKSWTVSSKLACCIFDQQILLPAFWHLGALRANCDRRIHVGVFWLVDQMPGTTVSWSPISFRQGSELSRMPRHQFFGSEVTTCPRPSSSVFGVLSRMLCCPVDDWQWKQKVHGSFLRRIKKSTNCPRD